MPLPLLFLIPTALTVGRLLFTASRIGAVAVMKNPIKAGIVGLAVDNKEEVGEVIEKTGDAIQTLSDASDVVADASKTVSDNSTIFKTLALFGGGYYIYRKIKK